MNADELKASLQAFYDNVDELGISLYAILKQQDNMGPRRIDIEGEALQELKNLFIQSLKEKISDREALSVVSLSESDERLDAIYIYDVEIPPELLAMEEVLNSHNLPLFDFIDTALSDIKAILIEIGNNEMQLTLYKTLASINVFGRASFFLRKSAHRMEKIDEEFLRISSGFQLLRIGEELLVMDLSAIEKSFGFAEIIMKEASAGVASIEARSIVDNPEVLRELIDDIKYARRLTKVAKASPVIKKNVENAHIIAFCQSFPALAGKIRFNAAGDKIVLDTKVSKDLFIKLLMDNFLTSELTNFHYESVAKDVADVEAEEVLVEVPL